MDWSFLQSLAGAASVGKNKNICQCGHTLRLRSRALTPQMRLGQISKAEASTMGSPRLRANCPGEGAPPPEKKIASSPFCVAISKHNANRGSESGDGTNRVTDWTERNLTASQARLFLVESTLRLHKDSHSAEHACRPHKCLRRACFTWKVFCVNCVSGGVGRCVGRDDAASGDPDSTARAPALKRTKVTVQQNMPQARVGYSVHTDTSVCAPRRMITVGLDPNRVGAVGHGARMRTVVMRRHTRYRRHA